ncbi:unnamed protein product [Callosobruchus maculatus]|uniref:Serpin domain-containing protein n=2 Tax=Callosobruchus maculatus TaxID=64391 RepID=A0A653D6N0_CALMS|nr:unnamed protein product [Callosobruchus maculatus]
MQISNNDCKFLATKAEGAASDTLSEITEYLGITQHEQDLIARIGNSLNDSNGVCQIVSANKVYISDDYEVNETFNYTSLHKYNSTVEVVDFKTPEKVSVLINEWVEDHSNGKIQNLIHAAELHAATIILVNVIYFSATWAKQFRPKNTSEEKFYTSKGKHKEVLMMKMSRHTASFWHSKELEVKFLQLPFTTEKFTMTFILPDAKDGLSLQAPIEKYLNHKEFSMRKVRISIPKFSTEISLDLVPFLKQEGIKTLFSSSADLTGVSPKKGLSVSSLQQKVLINVTEKGVEATSATYGIMNKILQSVDVPEETEDFIADHPFLFVLREKENDMIIFIGQFVG